MPTIWNDLLHLFFPKLCIACKQPLIHREEQICLNCLCDLPQTNFHLHENNPVSQLFTGKADISTATAFYYYEKGSKVQQLIHSFKYYGNKDLAYQLGRQMGMAFQTQTIFQPVDILIPVPLHPKKERKRGYNQSEWLCRGIASVWQGMPVCTTILKRKSISDTQTNKNLYDRWRNVQEIFSLQDQNTLSGKHILLVDDVITSGSTVIACAETLLSIPDIHISVLALAVA